MDVIRKFGIVPDVTVGKALWKGPETPVELKLVMRPEEVEFAFNMSFHDAPLWRF